MGILCCLTTFSRLVGAHAQRNMIMLVLMLLISVICSSIAFIQRPMTLMPQMVHRHRHPRQKNISWPIYGKKSRSMGGSQGALAKKLAEAKRKNALEGGGEEGGMTMAEERMSSEEEKMKRDFAYMINNDAYSLRNDEEDSMEIGEQLIRTPRQPKLSVLTSSCAGRSLLLFHQQGSSSSEALRWR